MLYFVIYLERYACTRRMRMILYFLFLFSSFVIAWPRTVKNEWYITKVTFTNISFFNFLLRQGIICSHFNHQGILYILQKKIKKIENERVITFSNSSVIQWLPYITIVEIFGNEGKEGNKKMLWKCLIICSSFFCFFFL